MSYKKVAVLLMTSVLLVATGCRGDGNATATQLTTTQLTAMGVDSATTEVLTTTQSTATTSVTARETAGKTTTGKWGVVQRSTTTTAATTARVEPTETTATTPHQTTATDTTTVTSTSRKTVASRSTGTTTTLATTTTKPSVKPEFPVTPTMDIAQSALLYNNKLSSAKTKLKSEYFLVAEFNPEYSFAHQPGLMWFKDKLYATWASGYTHEDAPGQRIVVASSADNGETWTQPMVVGDTTWGELGLGETCMMGGYLWTDGDVLYNYFTEYEYNAASYDSAGKFILGNYKLHRWQVYVSHTTDGVRWSEPEAVNGACRFNESPRLSLTGKWFAGAGNRLGYADNPDGYNWKQIGLTNAQVANAQQRGAKMLTECSWYQTDDYVLHMMMRSNAGYIWMSESYDNGKTWTEAYCTNISSDNTMMNFGRLPDGRYYFVGSVVPNETRYPLDLYLSEDGVNFNKGYTLRDEKYVMKKAGWAKGGYFAYPEVLIHDEYMYIFYSKQKEVVELTRIKLSDIQ